MPITNDGYNSDKEHNLGVKPRSDDMKRFSLNSILASKRGKISDILVQGQSTSHENFVKNKENTTKTGECSAGIVG